jgi:hypothetical protein
MVKKLVIWTIGLVRIMVVLRKNGPGTIPGPIFGLDDPSQGPKDRSWPDDVLFQVFFKASK